MPTVDTQLVDSDVVYCSAADVFRHVRNKGYDDLPTDRSGLSQGGLSQRDVNDLIRNLSERADTLTKRAWRTRKVEDLELRVKFEHAQKHARHRRRKNRRSNTYGYEDSSRAFVRLPHNHVKQIDAGKGDEVIVLNERSTNDITTDQGRDEGRYYLSTRKGVLRPDVRLFTPVTTASSGGRNLKNGSASVRVTYRYGYPANQFDYTVDADTFGSAPLSVSTQVPLDVRDAVGKMVAARLIESDQYGNLVPNAGDDTPNLGDAASRLRDTAIANLRDYKRA